MFMQKEISYGADSVETGEGPQSPNCTAMQHFLSIDGAFQLSSAARLTHGWSLPQCTWISSIVARAGIFLFTVGAGSAVLKCSRHRITIGIILAGLISRYVLNISGTVLTLISLIPGSICTVAATLLCLFLSVCCLTP